MEATILRYKKQEASAKQVLGELSVRDDSGKTIFNCKTLELADRNNEPQKSCIPIGKYKVVPRFSEKYGNHLHITNVVNRSFILIHQGNYYTQILGCVLVGRAHLDLNRDGVKDVTSSKDTLKQLVKIAPKGFDLTVIWEK